MSQPMDKFDEVFGDLDQSYSHRAYRFVLAAVGHIVGRLSEPRHISGQELLIGLVELGRNHFGPLAGGDGGPNGPPLHSFTEARFAAIIAKKGKELVSSNEVRMASRVHLLSLTQSRRKSSLALF